MRTSGSADIVSGTKPTVVILYHCGAEKKPSENCHSRETKNEEMKNEEIKPMDFFYTRLNETNKLLFVFEKKS